MTSVTTEKTGEFSVVSPTPIPSGTTAMKSALEQAKSLEEEQKNSTLDLAHFGVSPQQATQTSSAPIRLADVQPYVKDYSQANSYDAQHTIISAIASMAPFIDPIQENGIVQLLSEMKDGKGVKLFESKEEVIRFLSRARGLRGNVKNNNKGKNRRAIFLNTSNRILPPEEIVEKNGRLYVDKHPLAYQF